MQLARFPRHRLFTAPTPLERMARLEAHLRAEVGACPTLWVKRDDLTGVATGGNKVRKLEFLIGEALSEGADHIVTQGAVQSNHVRQTAAVAARLGLRCTALLEHRIDTNDRDYLASGNVLLDRLFDATIAYRPGGTDMNAAIEDAAATLRAEGERPYAIPGGGSNATGALGYVACATELLAQADDQGIAIDRVVHATGSAGTQAGLVAGLHGARSTVRVLGIGVRAPQPVQEANVHRLAEATAAKLGIGPIPREAVVADCGYVGEGYGRPTAGMTEAVRLVARLEGLLLDPVYSGKGMAGLIDHIRRRAISAVETVVFLHTGGAVGLFGYLGHFEAALAN